MKKLNKIAASVLVFSVLNINTYSALAQENKYNTNGEVPLASYIKVECQQFFRHFSYVDL